MKIRGFLVLFLLLMQGLCFAGGWEGKLSFTPGIKIGYTFSGGLSYGMDVDIGLAEVADSRMNWQTGMNLSTFWIHESDSYHWVIAGYYQVLNKFADLKMGYGWTKYKWGTIQKRNKVFTSVLAGDIAISTPNRITPWVGISYFKFKDPNWKWKEPAFRSIYTKYKVPNCTTCNETDLIRLSTGNVSN